MDAKATASPRRPAQRAATSALLAVAGLATSLGAFAAPANPQEWKLSGDLRGGWFASEQTARNGNETDQDAFNARLRVAIERSLGDRWTVRTRVAGRFSSDQDGTHAYLRGYAPTRSGAAFGDVTLDEAYVGYQAPDNGMRWKVGRFQTAFAVPGVASKGLDRNDSPNIDVQWTDGVHLDMPVTGDWRGHVIAQYRHENGSGGVAHAPLDFTDNGSRATLFLGLENRQRLGPITQRMVSLTWMPDSLATRGLGNPVRDDYTAIDARLAAEWPLGERGARFVTGAEVAYAFETPQYTATNIGGSGDTGGFAWQLQASVYDFAPKHHIGVAIGRADAGWLLSPDYRPNDRSAEIRYQWQFLPKTSMEARFRERTELEHPAATRARVDRDVYLRITHKF